jgi:gamma-glutamyltranspeptidase/glutathione hydrolase
MTRRLIAAAAALLLAGAARPPANDLVAVGRHGAVVAAEPQAARIGLEMLRSGGNAIDAAVATFLALAVTHPQAGNLGGGGFLLVRMADGRAAAFDFRERAPRRAQRDSYLRADGSVDEQRLQYGVTAAGVPGSPAGIAAALARFGTRPLAELAAPAIRLARDGFAVDRFLADDLAEAAEDLARDPAASSIFFADGKPLAAGARLVQADLAATLERFAAGGADGFYRGETARLLLATMQRDGGWIDAEDLTDYEVVEREPLRGEYRGHELLTMPPPSSGGVAVLQMLRLLEPYDLRGLGFGSAASLHLLTEVMRRAYADRARWLGDPDRYPVPVGGLLSDEYAARLRAGIRTDQVSDVPGPGQPPGAKETDDTTHFSIVDAAGNAVACTTTINSTFGAKVVVAGAGFLLNNEMDDFSAKPGVPNQFGLVGGRANEIAPGKRMLSSMTPTILLRDGKPVLVLGSPGGGRIINTVLQVIVDVVDHGMPLPQAVAAPRIHHQWRPDRLDYEPLALVPEVRAALLERGHALAERPITIGRCQAIAIGRDGRRIAAADPRSGGAAVAY